jgi:hypothetical protein
MPEELPPIDIDEVHFDEDPLSTSAGPTKTGILVLSQEDGQTWRFRIDWLGVQDILCDAAASGFLRLTGP